MANNLIIPPAPGSPQPEPSDEELRNMSPEQFDALYKQHVGYGPMDRGYYANTETQAKAGAKEGAAGMLGTPAWLANMITAGGKHVTGALGGEFPATPEDVRKATAPYSTEAILQGKSNMPIPGVGRLALTPEQQQSPQNLWERFARGGAANVVGTAPLAALGPLSPAAIGARALSVLGRSGAATALGEGLGWLGDKYFPELAPWLKAGGTMLGYGAPGGLPGGFTAASRAERAARAPFAQTLEQAKQPVSAAERTGSRVMATAEQKGSARPDIAELKLDTRVKNRSQLESELKQVSADAKTAGVNRQEVQYINSQIDRAVDPKKGIVGNRGKINGEDYFKLSRQWEDMQNPHVNKLGQVLDRHVSENSPVWARNRENLSHVPDLETLEEAHRGIPFPKPYDPGEALATVGGAIPLIHALSTGSAMGPMAETASLLAMLRAPHVAGGILKGLSPIARSAPGQAFMGGWPTNQAATYAALLAGPGQRVSKDIWDPGQPVK
jgi:hypothetical protein